MMGNVFNIQRFSVHDGEGIRTTIFFKGCPLRCKWCHNPESISFHTTHIHDSEKCCGCGECVDVCESKASMLNNDKKLFVSEECKACGKCQVACLVDARELVGRKQTVQAIVDIVERDRLFFEESGGGVTLSGGEVLAQASFAIELAKALKEKGLHVILDTSGFGKTEDLIALSTWVDLVLYDLKVMNPEIHRQHTGVSNELILQNLEKLQDEKTAIQIRVPLIKGVSATDENVEEMMAFLMKTRIRHVALLPFHQIGRGKYRRLGLETTIEAYERPSEENIEAIKKRLVENGFTVQVGG